MTVEQIRVGRDNFSYLIYCKDTRKAALVDPGSNAHKAMGRVGHLGLKLLYIINTQHHGDHIGENPRVKKTYDCKIIASNKENLTDYDISVQDGEILSFGNTKLKFMHTPGHTRGSMCIVEDDRYLLTGDTLFIGDCGRTDLPGGDNSQMFRSMQKIKSLPGELIVYPGHDYGTQPYDSLGNQKKVNKALLAVNQKEFDEIP